MLNGKRLKIHKARVSEIPGSGSPGEVIQANEKGLVISCGQGSLEILSLQPESRSVMTTSDFLKSQTESLQGRILK